MTPAEILTATPELTAAFTAFRDELMAANSTQNAELGKAHIAAIDDLKAQLAQSKSDADTNLTLASDKAASELATAKADFAKELDALKTEDLAIFDAATVKLDAEIARLNSDLAACETMSKELAAKLDEANKGAAYMRDALAQLGNAQRSEIESLDALIVGFLKAAGEKVSNIAAFNNRALAEDDARKRAAAEAERAQRIADLKSKLAAEGAE